VNPDPQRVTTLFIVCQDVTPPNVLWRKKNLFEMELIGRKKNFSRKNADPSLVLKTETK